MVGLQYSCAMELTHLHMALSLSGLLQCFFLHLLVELKNYLLFFKSVPQLIKHDLLIFNTQSDATKHMWEILTISNLKYN